MSSHHHRAHSRCAPCGRFLPICNFSQTIFIDTTRTRRTSQQSYKKDIRLWPLGYCFTAGGIRTHEDCSNVCKLNQSECARCRSVSTRNLRKKPVLCELTRAGSDGIIQRMTTTSSEFRTRPASNPEVREKGKPYVRSSDWSTGQTNQQHRRCWACPSLERSDPLPADSFPRRIGLIPGLLVVWPALYKFIEHNPEGFKTPDCGGGCWNRTNTSRQSGNYQFVGSIYQGTGPYIWCDPCGRLLIVRVCLFWQQARGIHVERALQKQPSIVCKPFQLGYASACQ